MDSFEWLVGVVDRLRRECPWDRAQTHESLRPYVIEEAYEVVEAIDDGDMNKLRGELGDLLLQVVLHAAIAAESGAFDIWGVARGIARKMIRRHPHVFGEAEYSSTREFLEDWERIKQAERNSGADSILDDVPRSLPALMHAYKVQYKASMVGFDWPGPEGVYEKVAEELEELREAQRSGDVTPVEDEVGDLLFAAVNLARLLGVDPESALKKATGKFSDRFRCIEAEARRLGKKLEEMSLDEMESVWQEAKKREERRDEGGLW